MSEDLMNRVAKCVAEVLALKPENIKPHDRLVEDLGAESLDLVELMYLLEQEFGIRLSRDDVSLSAQLGIPEESIHQQEVLSAIALELLRKKYPDKEDFFKKGLTRRQLAELLTVEEIAKVVQRKIA